MNYSILRNIALISFAGLSTTVHAESHVAQADSGGVRYGSEDCNNDPNYLIENDILCSAVFSNTNVADYLDSLARRIPISMFAELNPLLGTIDRDTIIEGITILRVR